MVKAMVGGCCVCSDERGWDENPLVYCDGHGCNVAVHQACYGIVQVPKGPWFCRKCESQERIARVKCELCPSKKGALKRTDTGGWAHVVCALYIPEVRFGNVTSMEPIILASVPHDRFLKMCYICEERGKESKTAHGGCMNCNKQGCRQTFHVTCAQSRGFLCEENDGQSGPTVKYVGYCQFHWTKRSKGLLDVNNKTPDKDKMKLKLDKDKEKKPTPKTSTESLPSVPLPKPDNAPKLVSSNVTSVTMTETTATLSTSPAGIIPGMPKPRGRKPSTVKTLPTNSTTSNDSSPKTQHGGEVKESPLNSALPKAAQPPMEIEFPVSTHTSLDVTMVTTNSVVSPVQSCKNILSSSQSVAQPTPTPPPVSVPIPQAKPAKKPADAVKKMPSEVKPPPKKRPSSKSIDEPKKKVGRPLKHKDYKPKPRPTAGSRPARPAKPRTQSNKSKDLASPVGINSSKGTSSYSACNMNSIHSLSTSSPVSIHNSLPSSGTTQGSYVIPQPRLAGQLENGHRIQENKQTNGPLQLPSSLEQLLEYQWEQGAHFLMQQASQYDVASLMSSLHQLKADNSRLENRLDSLLARRSQLIQVNARLSAPMSCTPTSTLTTTTDTANKQPNKVTTSCTLSTTQSTKSVAVTKTTSSLANVETVGSPNIVPKVSAKLSHSFSSAPVDNKNTILKGKVEIGKTIKMTIPSSVTTGTLLTSTVPKMVTPNTVQPNQIKITMVQPHDKQKTTTTAPIAILPTATLQSTLPSQFLSSQQLQVLQAKTPQTSQVKNNKQPLLLPHQAVTSQTFTTQPFPQQQLVLLMQQQQQQQLQQLQHQVSDQRLVNSQHQLSSAQSKSASTAVHSQKFVPSAMQLGYPGSFVTFSDGLGGQQHIDVSKAAAFATLPTLVQLDKTKGLDLDKNGTALHGDKKSHK